MAVMVEELRHAVEQVQQQPEDIQRQIAELIALALEEREWDAVVNTPESQQFLAQLATEARRDRCRNNARP